MTQEIRKVQTTDSRTLISFTLKQNNPAGVLTTVNLTGLTLGAIKFELFDAATGAEVIAATTTGVTFSADSTGLVNYQFDTPMTIPAGYYNGFFLLTVSGKTDHFPVEPGGLRIEVNSHTQAAKDAYRAALAG